jgi:hypothetical protein
MDVSTCFTKDCGKPRFQDYYVCAEHFVVYAVPRYTDSLVINVETAEPAGAVATPPCPNFRLYPEAPPHNGGLPASAPDDAGENVTPLDLSEPEFAKYVRLW